MLSLVARNVHQFWSVPFPHLVACMTKLLYFYPMDVCLCLSYWRHAFQKHVFVLSRSPTVLLCRSCNDVKITQA